MWYILDRGVWGHIILGQRGGGGRGIHFMDSEGWPVGGHGILVQRGWLGICTEIGLAGSNSNWGSGGGLG
ncbi:unnamed protein product, partial [Staurois parvus]